MNEQAAEAWALPGSVAYVEDVPFMFGGICTNCRSVVFPKPGICPSCWSTKIEKVQLPRTGTLYSFTVVHVARKGWRVPYVIAYIDLEEGVRVSAPIACDPSSPPPIGCTVELDVKEIYRQEDGTPVLSHCFRKQD
ncbi:MAG: hypothetical protein RLZ98_186 [Pseudomonadota bacterium]|jgi:uncharacterized OB-fold protein